jgi:hypothetical protein
MICCPFKKKKRETLQHVLEANDSDHLPYPPRPWPCQKYGLCSMPFKTGPLSFHVWGARPPLKLYYWFSTGPISDFSKHIQLSHKTQKCSLMVLCLLFLLFAPQDSRLWDSMCKLFEKTISKPTCPFQLEHVSVSLRLTSQSKSCL